VGEERKREIASNVVRRVLRRLVGLIVPRVVDVSSSVGGRKFRMKVALPLLASHIFGDSYARAPLVSELLTYVAVSGGSTDDFAELFEKVHEYFDSRELEHQASVLGVKNGCVEELILEVRKKAEEFMRCMYELVWGSDEDVEEQERRAELLRLNYLLVSLLSDT
jgi:hypothetical protein